MMITISRTEDFREVISSEVDVLNHVMMVDGDMLRNDRDDQVVPSIEVIPTWSKVLAIPKKIRHLDGNECQLNN